MASMVLYTIYKGTLSGANGCNALCVIQCCYTLCLHDKDMCTLTTVHDNQPYNCMYMYILPGYIFSEYAHYIKLSSFLCQTFYNRAFLFLESQAEMHLLLHQNKSMFNPNTSLAMVR